MIDTRSNQTFMKDLGGLAMYFKLYGHQSVQQGGYTFHCLQFLLG